MKQKKEGQGLPLAIARSQNSRAGGASYSPDKPEAIQDKTKAN